MDTENSDNLVPLKQPGTRTEDPFLPFSKEMIPVWETIKKFFGIADNFSTDQLFVRSEKSNSFSFVSPNAREMLLNDDGRKLRVIHAGVKIITRHDSKDMAYDCNYRLSQEGIPPLLPFMSKRKITIAEEDFKTLLTKKDPFVKWFTPAARDALNLIAPGSLVFVIEATTKKEWSGFACAGWRGKVSCHLNLPKDEANALRHLFGIPVYDGNKKKGGEQRKPKEENKKEEGKPVEITATEVKTAETKPVEITATEEKTAPISTLPDLC